MTRQRKLLAHRILDALGPPLLTGVLFGNWIRLLRDNRFAVHPRYLFRALFISLASIINSTVSRYECLRHKAKVSQIDIVAPIFVIGHWRSGTTHLHNLLTIDQRFSSPTLYQVLFPHTFLTTESLVVPIASRFLPQTRPVDNVRFTLDVSYEDELAICIASLCSSHITMTFPRREQYYDRYLTFENVSQDEVEKWKSTLMWFARKITYRYGKRLILKSPDHTARIKHLLELFPDARFVYICRNPYAVFQSTRKIVEDSDRRQRLQFRGDPSFEDRIISQYKILFDAYMNDCKSIPPGNLCTVRYEDLEDDPVRQVEGIYQSLDLSGFNDVKPLLLEYCDSISSYKKNSYVQLPEELRKRIAREWNPSFQEFGYPK